MSELSQVTQILSTMTSPQLLIAFAACGAYATAQSALLEHRARQVSWFVAAVASLMFVLQSAEWSHATMLCVFAVAGFGSFAAMSWFTSHCLGVAQASPVALQNLPVDEPVMASVIAAPVVDAVVQPVGIPAVPEPVPMICVRCKPCPASGHA